MEGMSTPEATRNQAAIGATPLSTYGGVVVTGLVHRGHSYDRGRSPCSRNALVMHAVQNRCLQGSSLHQPNLSVREPY